MTFPLITRRGFIAGSAALLATTPLLAAPSRIEIWKAPQCGCCEDWAAHLQGAGFVTLMHPDGNNAARQRLGMPDRLASCHTAVIDGYALEGHVPAKEIRRLLRERPKAVGLAVPAMPVGSPGMDGPAYGGRRDAFDVLLVLKDGSTKVYQHYN